MTREEDVRHSPPLVFGRAGVDGRGQEAVLKRVGEGALLVADHARDEAHGGVGDDGRGQFAARQHIVADGDLERDEVFADAVIDALVVSAEDDEVLEQREAVSHWLVEALAVGRGVDHLVVCALGLQGRDGTVDRLDLHHHAGLAAEGIIVRASPFVRRVVAQVVQVDLRQPAVLRAPQDGIVSALFVEAGQQAQAGQPLLALVPQEARYEANLYALSHNMGFVHPGQTVYLRYGAYPYQKFGQYAAQVRDVAKTAAPLNELTDTAFPALQNQSAYRIRAELAQDFILAYGEKQPLMAGMQFEADIVQDRRRIYEWMVEPLFSIREKWSTNAE